MFMNDFARARKTAERAFMLMERHGIEPSAGNIMAWYAYAEGTQPDWRHKMEQLLANREILTDQERSEAICHFLLTLADRRAVFNNVNGVYSAVSAVVTQIMTAEGETSTFSRGLTLLADGLTAAADAATANEIVATILRDTRAMAEKYREMAEEMKATSDEVLLLRSKLEEARKQAITDPLSGLTNRRYFDARLREMAEEAERNGTALSLMMIDIDHFKHFNDQHGHRVGDEVIKLVANILTGALRGTDLAARYGGEEFAVLLPRTAFSQAVSLADRFRLSLASRPLVKRGTTKELGRVTVSIGVAAFKPHEPVEAFVERADDALYQAKRGGRNRVMGAC